MSARETQPSPDALDDGFEPAFGDGGEADLDAVMPLSSDKQRLAALRRRAERRLEEKRLREELGDDDLELGDF